MAYFLDLFSPQTWRAFLDSGRTLTGFQESMLTRARTKIGPGDIFICYLTGTSRWCGALRVESDTYVAPHDNDDVFPGFPVRFVVSTIVALDPESMIPAKNDLIWNNWSVTRQYDKNSNRLSGWLRSSLRQFEDEDGNFIVQSLIEQEANPTNYPLTARDLRILRPLMQADGPVAPAGPAPDVRGRLPAQGPRDELKTLANEVHLTEKFLHDIEVLLEDKKQVIFQGPPGTGKTYVARKLAAHLAGSPCRVTLVQLHPSYAYEDFVQGFRPTPSAGQMEFRLAEGPLLRAAKAAKAEPSEKHFLVIDEINRGNVAKVFGELYFLLEYREQEIHLQYQDATDRDFSLPGNLYIIGTMNTADRSIALVDLALRRRFYFVDFHPDKEPVKSVLPSWLEENAPGMDWVARVVDGANELLRADRHAAIGPSYFMKPGLNDEAVQRIWEHSVLPYLEERFFGNYDQLEQFNLKKLRRQTGTGSPPEVDAGDETGVDAGGNDETVDG